jgi:asparagine synthase (glutamine-hydrolysing)
MTARLLNGLSLSRECSLHEIEDIPGGERITFGTEQESRTALWHPAKFCLEQGREDSAAAAEELRATVLGVIAALASEHEHILVLLSGGLDSSIVTSCLSRSPYHANVTCLNFYITGAGAVPSLAHAFPGVSHEDMAKLRRLIGNADEREFAQKVADKCGFKILNRERRVFTLSPRQVRAAPLAPRPSAYAFLLDQDEMECEAAAAARATACFTGQGGDSIFFATQRAIGALDYAYLHPLGARLIREIRSTVSLSRESLAHVVKKAIKYGYLRVALPSPFDPMTRPHLLRDEIARGVPNDYFHHPWIDTAPRLCPGKHNHVRAVATSVPAYDNVYHREKAAPSVYPFASQPIVEMCLRTPTYVLLENGTSRGLARRAFRDMLPPEVQKRTTKACGTALYQNVVRYNMPTIRESLLDGMLIRHNILDRRKLEHYLTAEQPFLTVQAEQVIDYLACESWLAQVY